MNMITSSRFSNFFITISALFLLLFVSPLGAQAPKEKSPLEKALEKSELKAEATAKETSDDLKLVKKELERTTIDAAKGLAEISGKRATDIGDAVIEAKGPARFTGTAPVDLNYMVGPQDKIIINLNDSTGRRTQTFSPIVDDSGFISILFDNNEVRFSINGKPFKELRHLVTTELAKYTSDINAEHPESGILTVDVVLGEIRGISVFVHGEVRWPGQIHLKTTVSSIYDVLAEAGGITEAGSQRELKVRRSDGEPEKSFDLYNARITGRTPEEFFQLREGAMLYVPPKLQEVSIKGNVKLPGVYELIEGETLDRLVDMAGGLGPQADPTNCNIYSTQGTTETVFTKVNYFDTPDYPIFDGDQVEFLNKPITRMMNKVEILGAGVKQAGEYEWLDGKTIRQLIDEAGGLYSDAITTEVVLIRILEDFTAEYLNVNLTSTDSGELNAETKLQRMDKLMISSKFFREGGEKFVSVRGHVKQPDDEYSLSTGMMLSDLLKVAGGFDDPDFRKATYLEHGDILRQGLNGLPLNISFNLGDLLKPDKTGDIPLKSGDIVNIYSVEEIMGEQSVAIEGHVPYPSSYQYRESMRISDLLLLSGFSSANEDYKKETYLERGELIRKLEGGDLQIQHFNLSLALDKNITEDIELESGDLVKIYDAPPLKGDLMVEVTGHVKSPGEFPFYVGMRVSDLLFKAGGFEDEAYLMETYLDRAMVVRQEYRTVPTLPFHQVGDLPPNAQIERREYGIAVDYPFHLGKALDGDQVNDRLLAPGDLVQIYSLEEVEGTKFVSISGHVKKADTYQLRRDMRVRDLIFLARGFEDKNFAKQAYMERADIIRKEFGVAYPQPFNLGKALDGDLVHNHLLREDDEVIIYSVDEIEGKKYVEAIGQVETPGKYQLKAEMRISDLLFDAGGFNNPEFLRTVWLERANLIRNEKVIPINLQKVLAGDESENILLQRLDRLEVRPRTDMTEKRVVSIEGEVLKPGEYKLLDLMTLEDLLFLAGGLTDVADEDRIEIARFPAPGLFRTESASISVISLTQGSNPANPFILHNHDKVVVRRRAEMRSFGSVMVIGQVAYPGAHALRRHSEMLSDVLRNAGGLIESAAPDAAYMIRKDQRVAINLASAINAPYGKQDLLLMGGDEIVVPKVNAVVRIEGAVLFPHTIQFVAGKKTPYYIDLVGGVAEGGKARGAVIIYPNGNVRKSYKWSWLCFKNEVQAGSTILVPGKDGFGLEGERLKAAVAGIGTSSVVELKPVGEVLKIEADEKVVEEIKNATEGTIEQSDAKVSTASDEKSAVAKVIDVVADVIPGVGSADALPVAIEAPKGDGATEAAGDSAEDGIAADVKVKTK